MGPKAPRLQDSRRQSNSVTLAPSPRLERTGVQTRSQTARKSHKRMVTEVEQNEDTGEETAPCTPVHQRIETQSTSEPPGAPKKAKLRRTLHQLSPQAPIRKLDFNSDKFLDDKDKAVDYSGKVGD